MRCSPKSRYTCLNTNPDPKQPELRGLKSELIFSKSSEDSRDLVEHYRCFRRFEDSLVTVT